MNITDRERKVERLEELNGEIFAHKQRQEEEVERKAVENIAVNKKEFWRYANGKKKFREQIQLKTLCLRKYSSRWLWRN